MILGLGISSERFAPYLRIRGTCPGDGQKSSVPYHRGRVLNI